jgi:inositol-hexakisphosphate/diphosphoinositol-pentakisphosphate 1-kinase
MFGCALFYCRLTRYGDFEIVIFGDEAILDAPVEQWPVVDSLVAFYSEGFPLEKAKAYVDLRKPYLLNDIDWQFILLDRRLVSAKLAEAIFWVVFLLAG